MFYFPLRRPKNEFPFVTTTHISLTKERIEVLHIPPPNISLIRLIKYLHTIQLRYVIRDKFSPRQIVRDKIQSKKKFLTIGKKFSD